MNKNIKMVLDNGKASVEELRGLLTMARSQGLTRVILKMPVRLFAVDTRYQTEIRTNRYLGYLTSNWDERKLLPVLAVPHDEEGILAIVDGYGRTKASQIVNPKEYEYLECMVLLDAPTEQESRLKYEAELFTYQNRNVSKVSDIQKQGGLRCMEDKTIKILDELQKEYNFKYISTQGIRDVGVLGSYTEAYSICRVKGKECMTYILEIIRRSAFDRKANGYATYMMRALRDIWVYYKKNREEIMEFLSNYLREYTPVLFKAEAVSRYKMLDQKTAVSLYMEDLIVEQFDFNHVRETDGYTVKVIKAA